MRNTIYLVLLFVFPLFTVAQKAAMFSFDIGLTASENFYMSEGQFMYFTDNFPILNNSTFKKANYNVAVHYERGLTKNIFIKAGLELASHGYRLAKLEDLRWPDEYDGNGGFTLNPDYLHEFTPKTNVVSLIVPMAFRYEIPVGKFSPYAEVGLAVGVKAYSTSNSITETETKVNTTSIWNELTSFGNLGFGVNYQYSEKMCFYLQPSAQWELAETEGLGPHEQFYSFGVRLGSRITL